MSESLDPLQPTITEIADSLNPDKVKLLQCLIKSWSRRPALGNKANSQLYEYRNDTTDSPGSDLLNILGLNNYNAIIALKNEADFYKVLNGAISKVESKSKEGISIEHQQLFDNDRAIAAILSTASFTGDLFSIKSDVAELNVSKQDILDRFAAKIPIEQLKLLVPSLAPNATSNQRAEVSNTLIGLIMLDRFSKVNEGSSDVESIKFAINSPKANNLDSNSRDLLLRLISTQIPSRNNTTAKLVGKAYWELYDLIAVNIGTKNGDTDGEKTTIENSKIAEGVSKIQDILKSYSINELFNNRFNVDSEPAKTLSEVIGSGYDIIASHTKDARSFYDVLKSAVNLDMSTASINRIHPLSASFAEKITPQNIGKLQRALGIFNPIMITLLENNEDVYLSFLKDTSVDPIKTLVEIFGTEKYMSLAIENNYPNYNPKVFKRIFTEVFTISTEKNNK